MGRQYTRKRGLWRTRRSAAGGREARDELVVLYLAGLDEAERPVKVAGGRVAGRVAQCAGAAAPILQQAAGERLDGRAAGALSLPRLVDHQAADPADLVAGVDRPHHEADDLVAGVHGQWMPDASVVTQAEVARDR